MRIELERINEDVTLCKYLPNVVSISHRIRVFLIYNTLPEHIMRAGDSLIRILHLFCAQKKICTASTWQYSYTSTHYLGTCAETRKDLHSWIQKFCRSGVSLKRVYLQ